MVRRLVGWALEMVVTKSSPATFYSDVLFAVCSYFVLYFLCFCIANNGTNWYFKNFVFPIGAFHQLIRAIFAIGGHNMLAVFKMDKRPELFVAAQNNIATAASIASIRTAFGNFFVAVKVHRTCTTFPGTTTDFYIVYKIRFSHGGELRG